MATVDLGKLAFVNKGTWSSATAYAVRDVVQHTDHNETSTYLAVQASTNQAPSTNGTVNTSNWALIAKGTTLASNNQGTYASGTTYEKGDVVQYTDSGVTSTFLYVNTTSASGQTPSTSGTVNSTYWQLVAKGTDSVGISWQSVQTSDFTAVASRAYPVNTTGGSIAITLPSTAALGDTIILKDYARTWSTNSITIPLNGHKYQGGTLTPSYSTEGGTIEIVYVDVTRGWIPVHTTNSEVEDKTDISVRYLVVAGGGASARDNGGGGGAGGLRGGQDDANGKFNATASTTYTVTVGAGGGGNNDSFTDAGNSSLAGSGLTTITATRGGFGSTPQNTAQSGGSGGGAGQGGSGTASGNQGGFTPAEGNNGGANQAGSTSSGGAGGGGAGAAGQSVSASTGAASVGDGGDGLQSDITGTSTFYAGGGGGGCNQTGEGFVGAGGQGGGGDGGLINNQGQAGTANTGGGAGGCGQNYASAPNGQGGSGVVIVSLGAGILASSTGSPTITDGAGGKKILKFTGSGTFVTSAF